MWEGECFGESGHERFAIWLVQTIAHGFPEQVVTLLRQGGRVLMLAKPQFELQPGQLGKGGIVRDEALYPVVEQRLRDACAASGLAVDGWFDSPIRGGDGNREFFILATRT